MPMNEMPTQTNLLNLTAAKTTAATHAMGSDDGTHAFDRVLEETKKETVVEKETVGEESAVDQDLAPDDLQTTKTAAENSLLTTIPNEIQNLLIEASFDKEATTTQSKTEETDPNITAFLQNIFNVVQDFVNSTKSPTMRQGPAIPLVPVTDQAVGTNTTRQTMPLETLSPYLVIPGNAVNEKNIATTSTLNTESNLLLPGLAFETAEKLVPQEIMKTMRDTFQTMQDVTASDLNRDFGDWLSGMTNQHSVESVFYQGIPTVIDPKNNGLVFNAGGMVQSPQQIALPLDHNGWHLALSERVLWLTHQSIQGAEIRLNPPELGPLDIQIKLHQDQATVSFSSQHQVVRDVIEQAVPKLREVLQQNGLNLANVNVSDQSLARQSDPEPKHHFGQGPEEEEQEKQSPLITNINGYLRMIDFYA